MAKRIKFNIIQSLFRLFSFLADKTNGWIIFVKPKILLVTIILGLNACSNAAKQNQEQTDIDTVKLEVEIVQQPTDTVNTDTLSSKKNNIKIIDDIGVQCYIVETPQEPAKHVEKDTIDEYDIICYCIIDIIATFPGGHKALMNWLSENINYPIVAQENSIQGRVVVQFVVLADGSIDSIKIAKSVHPSLDNEAIRLVKSMPRWKPAERSGNKVNSRFTLPIVFIIKE
jgi:TonB family protein